MGFWGKIIGGAAGFALGGPPGLLIGAALGHAADSGAIGVPHLPFGSDPGLTPTRVAAMFGRRDQLFAINVVVLAAKLARCDGPVQRAEIDAFKRQFHVPPESARDVGRLFDQARENPDQFQAYAAQLGKAFADDHGKLESTLHGLFAIARADGALNRAEHNFLAGVHRAFGLDQAAWEQASGASAPISRSNEPNPYEVLGVSPSADDKALRDTWRQLMRENHPDSLAARGASKSFIAGASDKVARINAAWDRIKRERGL
jgi:DnaJ like chaperone protein